MRPFAVFIFSFGCNPPPPDSLAFAQPENDLRLVIFPLLEFSYSKMIVNYEIAMSIKTCIQIEAKINCVLCDTHVQTYTCTHTAVLVEEVGSDGS